MSEDTGATLAREELEGAPLTRECLADGKKTIGQVRGDLERLCVKLERQLREANERISGYQGSRDFAIDTLAGALGVEADKLRAVEYYARLASESLTAARAEATLHYNRVASLIFSPALKGSKVEEVRAWEKDYIDARAEVERLRDFTRKMFDLTDWPEGGDIDGGDFQDAAVVSGLLVPETRTESCGAGCFCTEYHGDMSDGVTCYRKTEWLSAAPPTGDKPNG